MKEKKQHSCPEADIIESLMTNQVIEDAEQNRVANHLQQCAPCRIIFNELSRFYTIFNDEAATPLSSTIFDLLNSIGDADAEITGVLLKPVEPLNGHKSLDYFAQVVVSSNAQANSNFQNVTLNRGEIFLRAVKSRATGESTLYLLSPHERLYRNIRLQISSEGEQFFSDGTGKVNLGKFDVANFERQIITVYLQD
ncbi:MAG: hypothetical protein GXO74_04450 [Calditrichaeota bacterium]|nr:hypothetical protein [Calditrichota bacterium]